MTASRFALTISSRPSMRPAETATPTHGRRRAHGRRTGQGVPARNPAPGESDEGGSVSELTTPIEAAAKAMAGMQPGEEWPTNEELGGSLTGTRDDEFRAGMLEKAKPGLTAALDALDLEGAMAKSSWP